MATIRPRGISSPPESDNEFQRWMDAVSDKFRGTLPPTPQVENANLQSWFYEVKDAIDGLPFSTFSTSDGPNQSAVTAPEGFIGVEIGSSSTKFWFKESGSTSTGWSPWDDFKGIHTFNTVTAAATTLNSSYDVVLGDATASLITVTLPAAATRVQEFTIKKIDASGNAVDVDGDGSETIDGSTFKRLGSQYDSIRIASNGASWWIL